MECYNFFQQCKNHFAIAKATGLNQVLFVTTFLKDSALFPLQQYQHKIKDKTNVFITWKKYKVFFCQNQGKSNAIIDTIWNTIRKNSKH